MRVSLIHNSKAGRRQYSRKQVKALLRTHGYAPEICDGAAAVPRDPGGMVVVAGGDGTVAATLDALMHRDVPVALLPVGTANNIARTLGIRGTLHEIVAGWVGAQHCRLDLGSIKGVEAKRTRFAEGAGFGLLARAMVLLAAQDEASQIKKATDPQFKLMRDVLALKALAAECPPVTASGSLDGEAFSGRFLLIEAMNLPCIGPNLNLAPGADPGDGILDFVFVPEERRDAFIDYLARRVQGQEAEAPVERRRGRRLRLSRCAVEGGTCAVHIDGKTHDLSPEMLHGTADLRISVEKHAATVLVPRVEVEVNGDACHSPPGGTMLR